MFDQVYLIKTYSALADLYPRRESGVVENEAWKRILTISIRSISETFGLTENLQTERSGDGEAKIRRAALRQCSGSTTP